MAQLNIVSEKIGAMMKIIIIAPFSCVLVIVAMRFFHRLRFQKQRPLQNPFVKAILFTGLWRILQMLIFWRLE